MTRVLVTGATGFVGQYVVPQLRAAGCEIVAVSRRSPGEEATRATWLAADLLNWDECRRVAVAARAECLLHLAWHTEHGAFWSAPENFAWSRATLELLEAFRQQGGRRAVIAGTCAEYDWSYGYCVEDATPVKPRTVYGACKDATRRLAESFCRANQLEFAWARIFFPYGPGEPLARLIPSVVRALLLNEPIDCSHGRQYRDFLYVEDVARALARLVCEHSAEGIFNVASGDPARIADLVMKCVTRLRSGAVPRFGSIEVPPDDPPLLVGDNRRLRALGWCPAISIDEGLARTVEWMKSKFSGLE
jgi:nucleoside-diphosphate-sugar epimerase